MKCKITLRVLMLMAVFVMAASVAWASPVVDANLSPDNEYDESQNYPGGEGTEQEGIFSKCYSLYVVGEGFYILNDWYDPCENFDPILTLSATEYQFRLNAIAEYRCHRHELPAANAY